jgi:glutamate racemase
MANKNSPICFFDSGVGGLSVYARFRELLPNENTIYFGDLKNLPYGNKSQDELIGFARKILDFFSTKDVKAVIIACNTSSALAYEHIKGDYSFKIYPIIQSSAKLIANMELQRIGVFATIGTVNSGAYKKEIQKYDPNINVKEIACPNWVSIVEGLVDDNGEDIKKHVQEMLEFNPDKIILGCTHYPYLLGKLKKYAPIDIFIDPAKLFVEYVSNDILKNDSHLLGKEEFYVSANPEDFVKNAKLFYDVKTMPKLVLT